MKQLLTIVVPRIAIEWKNFAHALNFWVNQVQLIRKKCRDDLEECCYNVLEDWINSNEGMTPKNWSTLFYVLEDLKEFPRTVIYDEVRK